MNESGLPAAICETRSILFRVSALAAAIETVGAPLLALPRDLVLSGLSVLPEADVVRISHGIDCVRRDVTPDELAAVLIAYCSATGIPVPKFARKDLRLISDGVVLVLESSLARAPRTPVRPHHRSAMGQHT